MEQPPKIKLPSKYDAASQWSKWTFTWMLDLFKLGSKKELNMEDMYECCKNDEPARVTSILEKEWEKEVANRKLDKKGKPSLTRTIIKAFGKSYLMANLIIIFCEVFLKFLQPFLVGYVVRFLSDRNSIDPAIAYTSAAFFAITSTVYCMTRHRSNIVVTRVGNNIRTALSCMLFKKVMRIETSSMGETSVGQIINILANDLNRFEELSWFLIFAIIGPLMSIFVIIVTSYYLNWAASLAGLVMLILFMMLQATIGRLANTFRKNTASISDKRIKKMSELISAMKIIKLYCWEGPFAKVVSDIREDEIRSLRRTFNLRGINSALFIATRIMLFAAFITFVLMGNTLNPEQVFVVMSLYDAIRIPVTAYFPSAISTGAETLIAVQRIRKILLLSDKKIEKSKEPLTPLGHVAMKRYCGKWNSIIDRDNLSDITLDIRPGQLVIVVGSVGSGKTCFLHALLQEIQPTGGSVTISGSTSFAPQESWCFGATVKQNILLNNEFLESKFSKVVKVCGLERDFQLFPNGPDTFVGEKGYSLSGGQKARVSLARAVYHDSDVYLFDDPLSAVDPKVANHIFHKCIKGYLKEKTVILVTHQLQFIPQADKIIFLQEGHLKGFGSFEELKSSNPCFVSLLTDESKKEQKDKRKEERELERRESVQRSISVSFHHSLPDDSIDDNTSSILGDIEEDIPQQINREEDRTVGKVDSKLYWLYLKSSGRPFMIFVVFLLTALAQALFQFTDTWLSAWTEKDRVNSTTAMAAPFVAEENYINLIVYGGLVIAMFLFGIARTALTYNVCLASSVNLHDGIFKSLLRAPISFYENNPLGRILNRCTRDVGVIDQVIPQSFADIAYVTCIVSSVIILSVVINYYLIIPCIAIGSASYFIRSYYLKTARSIQRLDSLARSPVYDHMSSAFYGLTALRAFNLQECFEKQFMKFMKESVSCRFLVISTQRSIGFVMDFLSTLYISAIVIAIMASPYGTIAGGDAGLILVSSLQIMGFFQFLIRQSADFETQMISCERVIAYQNLEPEAELKIADKEPPPTWPESGVIEFDQVSLWYDKSLPPVLRDLTFKVAAHDKIGIVGRTGAGKSSLVSILFRLVEPKGTITIDGQNIQSMGLHDVRNKISIIPQDPILFSGTIRINLDPFGQYPDDQLWLALQESNLSNAVNSMPGKLDAAITEGGSNLSVGQRQLLCLARALLKRNRILVCDEATANVDHETDELIQRTIKSKFKDCTVLTVAHRLNTIIDMDKVLVMDAGQVVEFDEPHLLLKNPNGIFYSMVNETGPEFSNKLHKLAEQAFFQRRQPYEGPEADKSNGIEDLHK